MDSVANASDVMVLNSGYFIQNLGLVPRVKGLYRDHTPGRHRWVVGHNNDTSTSSIAVFYDRVHGTAAASYKEAMKFLYAHSELLAPGTRRVIHEQARKAVKLGEPGICVHTVVQGNREYFSVRVNPMAEVPGKLFYIGRLKENDTRLETAIALGRSARAAIVKKYRSKRKVKLSDVMPWAVNGL